jgi:hypothetical protein
MRQKPKRLPSETEIPPTALMIWDHYYFVVAIVVGSIIGTVTAVVVVVIRRSS